MHVQPWTAVPTRPPGCTLPRVSTLRIIRDSVPATGIVNCTNETYTATILAHIPSYCQLPPGRLCAGTTMAAAASHVLCTRPAPHRAKAAHQHRRSAIKEEWRALRDCLLQE